MAEARSALRNFAWRWWFRRTFREALVWFKTHPHSSPEDRERSRAALCDCLHRLSFSTWFEWNDGSRLHFWRWPERWREEARDGGRPCVISRPPSRLKWPQVPQDDRISELDVEKIAKLISRRYLERGRVKVVIPRFCVPKGATDVRVVWDMTKNGVNPGLYAPSFYLIGIYSFMDRVETGDWIGDFDCGEMFNNYELREEERPYFGVFLSESNRKILLEKFGIDAPTLLRWCRLPFGWRSSPVLAIRMMMRGVEMAKGRPEDKDSAFQFSKVVLNLPTMENYDPGKPRVIKKRLDGNSAGDLYVFVDDGRIRAFIKWLTDQAMRQATSRIQFLGNQEAARKREASSTRPRAWTGGVVYTDKGMVRKFLVKKKWLRIQEIAQRVLDETKELDRKQFESDVGFLIHGSAVYVFLRPYLIGFYLAMNAYRGGRDSDGWRVKISYESNEGELDEAEEYLGASYRRSQSEQNESEDFLMPPITSSCDDGPPPPPGGPRAGVLGRPAATIARLVHGETPLQLLVRPIAGTENICYAGSDASGEGFGTRDWLPDQDGEFVYGFWNRETEESSSNWREMKTALDKIRRDARRLRLQGREVWFVTDNSCLERAFYKGYSPSMELYQMVEELRALSLEGDFILNIVHVAGTRIIDLGIDGLSRGELETGLMSKSLRDQIPLSVSPCTRSPGLYNWLQSIICADDELHLATPYDWHYNAHQSGAVTLDARSETWLWDLPPAAAHYALEELAIARTKRHELLRGFVVVPALLSPEWHRRFCKTVDLYVRVPAGAVDAWNSSLHESLTIGFYFPTFRSKPWDWRNVKWMGEFGRALSAMFKVDPTRAGGLLSQFWEAACNIERLHPSLVWRLLSADSWKAFLRYAAKR